MQRSRSSATAATSAGYDLVLFDVENPRQREDAFAAFARADRVDGALVISLPLLDSEVAALRAEGLPFVLVDAVHPELPHIAVDDVRRPRTTWGCGSLRTSP